MSKSSIPINSYESYAISCLLIAAKAVELDEKIPYISKLLRFCDKKVKIDDIKHAEKHVLELLDWDLQICTIVDLLEFYLSQGILWSFDEIYDKKETLLLKEKDGNIEKMTNNGEKMKSENWVRMESLGEEKVENVVRYIEGIAYSMLLALVKGSYFDNFCSLISSLISSLIH